MSWHCHFDDRRSNAVFNLGVICICICVGQHLLHLHQGYVTKGAGDFGGTEDMETRFANVVS
jgi:hypothetical protein